MVKAPSQGAQGDMSDLPALQPLPTAAERAADVIRESIFEGRFTPGMALPEAALAKALRISRNTVREAFRTLSGEHLLVYEPHKGVMVKMLTVDDVRDIYNLRRIFELNALDLAVEDRHRLNVGELGDLATMGERAAEAGHWTDAGTVNLRFHAEIVETHRSARINEVFHRLMTEMRLGFLTFPDQGLLHGHFVPRNRTLYNHIAEGRLTEARQELAAYLDDAQDRVIAAVRDRAEESGS